MGGRVHYDHDHQDQSIRVQSMGFDSWRGMETAHSRPRITALTYTGRMSILELASKGIVKHWLRSNTLKMGSILPEYMLYTELGSCMGCFPGGSDSKASACNAGDQGSIPGLGRSPGEGNGNPLQCSCLENPMNGGAW